MHLLPMICLAAALLCAANVGAETELRLDEDRISLRAEDGRLQDILRDFVQAGVSVEVEPGLDSEVHGVLEDVQIHEALEQLLEGYNYVLFWDVVKGPVGPLNRLAAIHVFRPGRHDSVVPFAPRGDRLVVVRIPGIPAHVKDELLLGVKPGTTPEEFRELLASIGGTVVDSLPELGVYQVRLPADTYVPAVTAGLAQNPRVAAVEPNYVYDVPQPARGASSTGTGEVRAAPAAGTGHPALAIFDSGLQNLDVLRDAVVGSYDAVNPSRGIDDPLGHGTQMALIATGAVTPGGAPVDERTEGVPVLAVRSFDEEGQASNFTLLRGINYVAEQGGRVISMSWGTEVDSDFLAHGIGYAQELGMIVVASAGNEPNNRSVYPAAYSGVVAVGALEADGTLWENSNYGDWLTITAPGTGEFPVGYEGPPGSYAGTSIASPYVARALALYLADHPDAGPDEAIRALTDAVTDAGEEGRDAYYGFGVLDAAAMERLLGSADPGETP